MQSSLSLFCVSKNFERASQGVCRLYCTHVWDYGGGCGEEDDYDGYYKYEEENVDENNDEDVNEKYDDFVDGKDDKNDDEEHDDVDPMMAKMMFTTTG